LFIGIDIAPHLLSDNLLLPIHRTAISFSTMFHVWASGLDDKEPINLSGGLVEIAALTAVIGGSTAELITLGNRGACGLPWAALSSFGSIFIIKACISACTPGWLRDTVGVRTNGSDKAVGCCMKLSRKANSRVVTGSAAGVTAEWTKVCQQLVRRLN
jgi:hypothetical protein